MSDPADGDTGQPDKTFRLMYRSHDLIEDEDRKLALGGLFSQARSNNKQRQITGALLVSDRTFVQVLEGEEPLVRAVYETISADPRHDSVELLATETVPERVFGRWSMARVAEDGEQDIPLIAHTDGIARAAGRRVSPAAAEMLAAMREAAAAGASG